VVLIGESNRQWRRGRRDHQPTLSRTITPARQAERRERLKPILQGAIAFVRHIDRAAACMYALQHEVLPAQGIAVQGVGRQAYRT